MPTSTIATTVASTIAATTTTSGVNNNFIMCSSLIALAIVIGFLLALFFVNRIRKEIQNGSINDIIAFEGFEFDPRQDIFFSRIDAWQREFGYCRLYDDAAAPMNMIIDCEPVEFDYAGKHWLIELWKGQYGLSCGAEVGIYATDRPHSDKHPFETFYKKIDDSEFLSMYFSLKRQGILLFTRAAKHWWLTGFRVGEFSDPADLQMVVIITLKDSEMCKAFTEALQKLGYNSKNMSVKGNTVRIIFDVPYSKQPVTRTAKTDKEALEFDLAMCDEFNKLTQNFGLSLDKLEFLRSRNHKMYDQALSIGKNSNIFFENHSLKKYFKGRTRHDSIQKD
ncbi:MAG: DUF4474 domain-containing protein [Bacillota bacterium]|nr:DUF4474 domain-containing protein [Bacillota bacterium]